MRKLAALLLFLVASSGDAQSGLRITPDQQHAVLQEFVDFLKLPNIASDRVAIRANADRLMTMLASRNLSPRILEGASQDDPPAVYGEWLTPGAKRTIVFYAHYDGQPTDPGKWTITQPWNPVFYTDIAPRGRPMDPPAQDVIINPSTRIYARSSSDDKAGVIAILAAIDMLRTAGKTPGVNIKLFFDGEEEAGSPHLEQTVARHRDLLKSDAWVICDGPVHQSGRKQVVFGVRGDVNVNVTVYGPTRPLHSGHYGNWIPNPGMTLAKLLASMKDANGRVTIAGWYSDVEPLGSAEKAALKRIPPVEKQLLTELGIARPEGSGKSLVQLITEPSLNVNGIESAEAGGGARNVITTHAIATLDLRLVKGNDYKRQIDKLRRHIRKQGFLVLDREPTTDERLKHAKIARVEQRGGGYNAERTPMSNPFAARVAAAVQSTSRQEVVLLPTAGGSLPLAILTNTLGALTLTVPIANYDNNQHAEDENIRLGNLFDGIETMAAVMQINW
ncbi:MAG: M20/M25/M40 family metallo-hydrolase [Gemmatimonadaceae bacterium]|nr:M20/M25/M40 family metallo-hydrolase [Gemmatimonadaceae bacterium]